MDPYVATTLLQLLFILAISIFSQPDFFMNYFEAVPRRSIIYP